MLEEVNKKMSLIQKSEKDDPEAGPEPADNPAGRKKE